MCLVGLQIEQKRGVELLPSCIKILVHAIISTATNCSCSAILVQWESKQFLRHQSRPTRCVLREQRMRRRFIRSYWIRVYWTRTRFMHTCSSVATSRRRALWRRRMANWLDLFPATFPLPGLMLCLSGKLRSRTGIAVKAWPVGCFVL